MKSKEFTRQESDDQLIGQLKQLEQTALSEETASCQVCGAELREGSRLVAYAFRPADEPTFEIGHLKCTDDRRVPTECVTLGVRELVIAGRVGQCSDVAMQSSWPVLLAPEPLVVSPESTTAAVPVSGAARFRRPPEESDACRAVGVETTSDTKLQPWQRPVVVKCDEPDGEGDDRTTARESGKELHSVRADAASVLPDGEESSWPVGNELGGDR